MQPKEADNADNLKQLTEQAVQNLWLVLERVTEVIVGNP